jgi:hypothetical protein
MANTPKDPESISVKVKANLRSRILDAINKEVKESESGGAAPLSLYHKNSFLSGYGMDLRTK